MAGFHTTRASDRRTSSSARDDTVDDQRHALDEPHARGAVHALEIQLHLGETVGQRANVEIAERRMIELLVSAPGRANRLVPAFGESIVSLEPVRVQNVERRATTRAAELFARRRRRRDPREREVGSALHGRSVSGGFTGTMPSVDFKERHEHRACEAVVRRGGAASGRSLPAIDSAPSVKHEHGAREREVPRDGRASR